MFAILSQYIKVTVSLVYIGQTLHDPNNKLPVLSVNLKLYLISTRKWEVSECFLVDFQWKESFQTTLSMANTAEMYKFYAFKSSVKKLYSIPQRPTLKWINPGASKPYILIKSPIFVKPRLYRKHINRFLSHFYKGIIGEEGSILVNDF